MRNLSAKINVSQELGSQFENAKLLEFEKSLQEFSTVKPLPSFAAKFLGAHNCEKIVKHLYREDLTEATALYDSGVLSEFEDVFSTSFLSYAEIKRESDEVLDSIFASLESSGKLKRVFDNFIHQISSKSDNLFNLFKAFNDILGSQAVKRRSLRNSITSLMVKTFFYRLFSKYMDYMSLNPDFRSSTSRFLAFMAELDKNAYGGAFEMEKIMPKLSVLFTNMSKTDKYDDLFAYFNSSDKEDIGKEKEHLKAENIRLVDEINCLAEFRNIKDQEVFIGGTKIKLYSFDPSLKRDWFNLSFGGIKVFSKPGKDSDFDYVRCDEEGRGNFVFNLVDGVDTFLIDRAGDLLLVPMGMSLAAVVKDDAYLRLKYRILCLLRENLLNQEREKNADFDQLFENTVSAIFDARKRYQDLLEERVLQQLEEKEEKNLSCDEAKNSENAFEDDFSENDDGEIFIFEKEENLLEFACSESNLAPEKTRRSFPAGIKGRAVLRFFKRLCGKPLNNRGKGSHVIFALKNGENVAIPNHSQIKMGTLFGILRTAGIDRNFFFENL